MEADERKLYLLSAVSGHGIPELLFAVTSLLGSLPKQKTVEPEQEVFVASPAAAEPPAVWRDEQGDWHVEGESVEELVGRFNIYDDDALHYFYRIIKNQGIIDELRRKGIKEGDTVLIGQVEFQYTDEII